MLAVQRTSNRTGHPHLGRARFEPVEDVSEWPVGRQELEHAFDIQWSLGARALERFRLFARLHEPDLGQEIARTFHIAKQRTGQLTLGGSAEQVRLFPPCLLSKT